MEVQITEQKLLVEQRQALFSRVQRCHDTFKTLLPDDVQQSQPRYDRMLLLEGDFDVIQAKIMKFNSRLAPGNKAIEVEQVQASFEALFYAAQGYFIAALRACIPTPASAPRTAQVSSLPKIDIPVFSGDIIEWNEYYSLFKSLIDENDSLNEVQKFHYLRSTLRGTALSVVSGLQITRENYPLALHALVSRYQNSRMLASLYVQQILEFTPLKSTSHAGFQSFLRVHKNSIDALKTLALPDLADFILLTLSLSNLDMSTRKAFENKHSSHNTPSYASLIAFIEEQSRTMELCGLNASLGNAKADYSTPKRIHSLVVAKTQSLSAATSSEHAHPSISPWKQACSQCSGAHYIASCTAYLAMTANQRRDLLGKKNLCFNCLGPHQVQACRSQKNCRVCNARHHTSIHNSVAVTPQSTPSTPRPEQGQSLPRQPCISNTQAGINSHHALPHQACKRTPVLLATVLVHVCTPNGNEINARALLDQGSEISFVSESLVQQLHLSRRRAAVPLLGIGAQHAGTTQGIVSLSLRSHFISDFKCDVSAYILPNLTALLPSTSVQSSDWPHLDGLTLADPHYMTPGKIDLILGADIYGQLIEDDLIKGPPLSPIAQRTNLGWILSGPVTTIEASSPQPPAQGFRCSIDHDLHDLIERFWIQEETPKSSTPALSPDEAECEAHFASTHSRDSTGRYIVRLPFKTTPDNLGDSLTPASRMLSRLTKQFSKDALYYQRYSEFLDEYENLGHMRRVLAYEPEPKPVFYLPHHGVVRESSSTTKLRVVFNASCHTDNGSSLNEHLHIGEKLQTDLADVVLWWRQFKFVFSSDIEKMFRQIRVHQDDWDFQRILWTPDLSRSQLIFQLVTVTYGLAPAPYLALRVLKQLTLDEGHRFPLAVDILRHGTYVDDAFGGADTPEEARQVLEQLDGLCTAGGFKLQKWTSNDDSILNHLSKDRKATSSSRELNDQPLFNALGISWQPLSDDFVFTMSQEDDYSPTKRKVLSKIAQLFDPLGWLSPVTVRAKMLLQELWLLKLGWDDSLPPSLAHQWSQFMVQLKDISIISIPRWLGTSTDQRAVELHGFSDASQLAMASVIYVRVLSESYEARITIVGAKTKVAPLKRMTIPRLELTAAAMLTRQMAHIRKVLDLSNASVHLWTDSSVTLAWIRSHSSRWKDYVRNRVSAIQEILPDATWHHVSGKENPADCASRGLSPQQLKEESLWWTGPEWLSQPPTAWPESTPTTEDGVQLEERRAIVVSAVTQKQPQWDLLTRYSCLTRLLRITAICRRVISRMRRVALSSLYNPLTPAEIESARLFWVGVVQLTHFSGELKILSQNHVLPRSNSLARLTPYLDASNLLRIGGRLKNALLDPDAKHPLILPRESTFTRLVIADAHTKTMHGGTQITTAHIRRAYWILGGRVPVRSFILRCVKCTRHRGISAKQLMGQLPATRVTPSRPFLHSGVDYAGPFTVKTWKGRAAKTYKSYIVLFVCFSTSAIHLEVATDYSTDGFLAAYKRFTGRRGICATLSSDCGTNFVGADAELRNLFSQASVESNQIANLLANDGTTWKFNPPSAPHFGGKWEAGVKSVKFHLRRVIGETLLTYEEFSTLLIQIEAVLNSRPLCPISDDASDVTALTPGHFLIGAALTSVPEPTLADIAMTRLSRWQLIRQMLGRFWSRWSAECLQRFLAIGKWHQPSESITVGALVLIMDERYPPAKWPLARVTETHPGPDGLTRVVTVKTATSSFRRPVVKLCRLPVSGFEASTSGSGDVISPQSH